MCVVVGSSIFDEVTVIERRTKAQSVPQSKHIHALQSRVLEELLLGLPDELEKSGAVTIRWTEDVHVWLSRGYIPQFDAKLKSIGVSPHHLETVMRNRVH